MLRSVPNAPVCGVIFKELQASVVKSIPFCGTSVSPPGNAVVPSFRDVRVGAGNGLVEETYYWTRDYEHLAVRRVPFARFAEFSRVAKFHLP